MNITIFLNIEILFKQYLPYFTVNLQCFTSKSECVIFDLYGEFKYKEIILLSRENEVSITTDFDLYKCLSEEMTNSQENRAKTVVHLQVHDINRSEARSEHIFL